MVTCLSKSHSGDGHPARLWVEKPGTRVLQDPTATLQLPVCAHAFCIQCPSFTGDVSGYLQAGNDVCGGVGRLGCKAPRTERAEDVPALSASVRCVLVALFSCLLLWFSTADLSYSGSTAATAVPSC